jgi:DNA-binding NarL/FixJ family response regulator
MSSDRYPILRSWTAEEERQLRELITKGLRAEEIGEALSRSTKAVRNRAHVLGLGFGRPKRRTAS